MTGERKPRAGKPAPSLRGAAVAPTRMSSVRAGTARRRRWQAIATVVSIAAVAGAYLGYREYQLNRVAKLVRERFAERRFAAAREPLSRWLAARPSSGEAHYYRAWSAL